MEVPVVEGDFAEAVGLVGRRGNVVAAASSRVGFRPGRVVGSMLKRGGQFHPFYVYCLSASRVFMAYRLLYYYNIYYYYISLCLLYLDLSQALSIPVTS